MYSGHDEEGEQLLPDDIMLMIMDALPPEEACRMSVASKSLRQHYKLNITINLSEAGLKRAMKNRDEANAALISDRWRWRIAVRSQPGESAYKYHLVMQERIQCVTKTR